MNLSETFKNFDLDYSRYKSPIALMHIWNGLKEANNSSKWHDSSVLIIKNIYIILITCL